MNKIGLKLKYNKTYPVMNSSLVNFLSPVTSSRDIMSAAIAFGLLPPSWLVTPLSLYYKPSIILMYVGKKNLPKLLSF